MMERFFGFLKPRIRFQPVEGAVRTLPPPDTVTLPLSAPGQMPFNPVVEEGERVKTGQFIAMLPSRTGVHASVTGTVTRIGPGYAWDGEEILTLTIQRDGDDEFETPHVLENLESASRDELIETLADLGFGSPWKPERFQDKLTNIERIPIHTVIITAVDEEPPISVQRRFLTEFADDFTESVAGIRKIAGDARIVVAVPEELRQKAESLLKHVEIYSVPNDHIKSNITILVHDITGMFFTAHRDPRQEGIAVFSAEDVAFVGRCLHRGKSRTNKLVTVNAPQLDGPVTVRVRLGTPVGHVLSQLNIPVMQDERIVFGGPLTGIAQPNLEAPITRQVNGITVIPPEEVVPFSDAPCTNCGRCVRVCPVHIQVNLVGRFAEFGLFEKAVEHGSGSCVECGLCAYVCPSRRPLMQYMIFANRQYQAKMDALRADESGEEGGN